jgi:EmrB/QacA subfamily drug resistance transporter
MTTTSRPRLRAAGLVALLVAEAMNLLDATIVQVAGPAVHAELGGPTSDLQWFGAAYTLAFAVLLITGGRLGDILGRRRLFRVGVAVFAVASVLCALAPSAPAVIAFRAVQGAAAAAVVPQTLGLIKAMYSGAALARALGAIGPVMGLAAVCGPLVGGVLIEASSWRAVFLVNVPLAAGVLALSALLPEDRAPRPPRLDLVGTGLVGAGTALVVLPLIGTAVPWPSAVAGLAVLAGFAAQQRRAANPLVERSLFADPGFPAALVVCTLFFAATTGLTLAVVLAAQLGSGASALDAGLTVAPWSVAAGVSSLVAGTVLVPRWGARLMPVGLAVLLLGALGAVLAYPSGSRASLLAALAVAGTGQGLFAVPFFGTALGRVRPAETGSAAGLLNAVQQIGGTLGTAVLGTVVLAVGAPGAFLAGAGLLVLAAPATLVMLRPRDRRPGSRRETGPGGSAL